MLPLNHTLQSENNPFPSEYVLYSSYVPQHLDPIQSDHAYGLRSDWPHASAMEGTHLAMAHTRGIGHRSCADLCDELYERDPAMHKMCMMAKHNKECVIPCGFA